MKYFLCLLIMTVLPVFSFATETRGLRVVAKDQVTNQTGEVQLYNKSYAVVIGIDNYQNLPRDRQLRNAVHDAKGVEAVLNQNFRFDKIIHLYNEEATKDRILELLTEDLPAQMGDQDSLFLFWAGHGNQELGAQGKEIGYLIPYDGEIGKLRKNLTMTELRDTISTKLPAKHVFYVMDACYGGLLASTRGVDKKSRRDLSYLKEITRENVRQVLTAGGKGEEVLDGGYKGHSVFTGRLVEALEAAGDFITANEIQTILREKVYGDSKSFGQGRTQTPAFGTLSGNGDYVFVPNIEQKSKDNSAKLAKMEAELKRLEAQEVDAIKFQTEQQQREARLKIKAAEARLKTEQLRQQELDKEAKRQQEMIAERLRLETVQKQREQELNAAQRVEDQRMADIKAELARKKQAAPASATGSLVAAVAEIKRLNAEIESIESAFDRELISGKSRIVTHYDSEISALRQVSKQQLLVRDEFETVTEFNARSAKQQAFNSDRIEELKRKQQNEISELEGRLTREQQSLSADLRQSLKQLGDREFTVGEESLTLELGQYNPDNQSFPVTISSKLQSIGGTVNGVIPLPRDDARKFKQEYSSGFVRPQAKLKVDSGGFINVVLANDSDKSIYEYVAGEFITSLEQQQRAEKLKQQVIRARAAEEARSEAERLAKIRQAKIDAENYRIQSENQRILAEQENDNRLAARCQGLQYLGGGTRECTDYFNRKRSKSNRYDGVNVN